MVLARAAALYEIRAGKGLFVNQTQSFEPAPSGDVIKCDVVISEASAFYPFVNVPDYLVVMSQNAYDRFVEQTGRGTIFILDQDGVDSRPEQGYYEIPALRRAEEMGEKSSANMIMLGALIGISGLLGEDSVRQAIAMASPSKAGTRNGRAFTEGMSIGRARLAAEAREGSG